MASIGRSGRRGLLWQGGSHGPGEFCAPDEQERDGDGGPVPPAANPQRPPESAGERGRGGVPLTEKQAGVGRCNGRGDR